MGDVDVITVKVPRELKKKMKQVDMNWSQFIRDPSRGRWRSRGKWMPPGGSTTSGGWWAGVHGGAHIFHKRR